MTLRRIFVDANVLIAGADSRSGASHAVLLLGEVGLYRIVVSTQVITEAERNLRRKLPRALPHFAALMAQLPLEITPDPTPEQYAAWQNIIEPKDAPILAAAVLADVARLITLNTKVFTPQVAHSTGIAIETPAQFIRSIRALINQGLNAAQQ